MAVRGTVCGTAAIVGCMQMRWKGSRRDNETEGCLLRIDSSKNFGLTFHDISFNIYLVIQSIC